MAGANPGDAMSRLLLVSNRLPFTLADRSGKIELQESSGGLATALGSYHGSGDAGKGQETLWIGWPGAYLHGQRQAELSARIRREFSAVPVWMFSEEMDLFYHGFCNSTLWPLFHYLPSYARYDENQWEAYKRVNLLFRDAVLDTVRPGDKVWIQDYQLLLLPGLLRQASPNLPIGFFLHIPFPSFEIFRLLPSDWRKEILEGMLGSDLIGFHTYDYTQYFLRSVYRTLGHEHNFGTLFIEDRIVRADTFPLGIDYARFSTAGSNPAVADEEGRLRLRLAGMKVIASVDRLDYTKGILQRLKGFQDFLEKSPDWAGKVVFILSVVPSREEVDQYQRMKKEIDETVGKINGDFGNAQWTPVIYQYRTLAFPALVALYRISDIALITPLRDGMNLVAKEFLAGKEDGTGVLILSEMAGAARELGEALVINPNHKGEIARAIRAGLEMPADEQVRRNRAMQERLARNDSKQWASGFQAAWRDTCEARERLNAKHLGRDARKALLERFTAAENRLILLDYDGTLIPFASHPQLAFPDARLMELLRTLSADPGNHVFIISGRTKETLSDWFSETGIGLIAEHGVWIREKGSDWRLLKPLETGWKPGIGSILKDFAERLPGSFLEPKEFSIAWHYRNADPELGLLRAKELVDTLVQFTANLDVQVLEGKKVVEVRCAGANKGTAASFCKETFGPGFTLAIGDDVTDEDLFRALPADSDTIRVGMKASYAGHNLRDYVEVRSLLEDMARADGRKKKETTLHAGGGGHG
jgi:trehalose 6-phosphate synthase/phosphatase